MREEKQILFSTQTESSIFSATGIVQVTVADHNGGTWTVQRRSPSTDTEWIPLDVEFDANGSITYYSAPGVDYRITGGTAGATGWYIEIPLRVIAMADWVESDTKGVRLI